MRRGRVASMIFFLETSKLQLFRRRQGHSYMKTSSESPTWINCLTRYWKSAPKNHPLWNPRPKPQHLCTMSSYKFPRRLDGEIMYSMWSVIPSLSPIFDPIIDTYMFGCFFLSQMLPIANANGIPKSPQMWNCCCVDFKNFECFKRSGEFDNYMNNLPHISS